MGLGMAAIGRPGYINLGHADHITGKSKDAMLRHSHDMLKEAFRLGIRHIDAARSYGLAENFVSDWLQERGQMRAVSDSDGILISSKWGYTYTADWEIDTGGKPHEVKDHSVDNLKLQALLSEELLGNHLGLYQIHSATIESGVLLDDKVLKELERIKIEKGWKIGFSCSGASQSDIISLALEKKMKDGSLLFDSVQATFNLMDQSPLDALIRANELGVCIIVKEALANGRLLQKEALIEMARDYQTKPDTLALAAVLKQTFEPIVLSGAATIEHLRSNFDAVDLSRRLPQEAVDKLMKECRQPSIDYWQERSKLSWN